MNDQIEMTLQIIEANISTIRFINKRGNPSNKVAIVAAKIIKENVGYLLQSLKELDNAKDKTSTHL